MSGKAKQGGDGGGEAPATIPTDRLLTLEQVCQLAGGISATSLRRAVRARRFPKPIAVFGRYQLQRWCPIEARRALGLPVPGERGSGRRK